MAHEREMMPTAEDESAERDKLRVKMRGPAQRGESPIENSKTSGHDEAEEYTTGDEAGEKDRGHGFALPEDQLPRELRGLKGGEPVTLRIDAVAGPLSVSVGGGPKLASFIVRRVTAE